MRIIFIVFVVFCSCQNQKFNSISEFYLWSGNPDNKLTKNFITKDYDITVKYLIPEYLAYKDCQNNYTQYDSILNHYKNSLSFLVSFNSKNKNFDPVISTSENMGDFKSRIYSFNFKASEYISLMAATVELAPALSTFENGYEMDTKRTFYIVFEKSKISPSADVDLKVDDKVFYSGIHHFQFAASDLYNIPSFSFIKNEI